MNDYEVSILKTKLNIIKTRLETRVHTDIRFLPKITVVHRDIKDELALVVALNDLIGSGNEHLINQYIDSL